MSSQVAFWALATCCFESVWIWDWRVGRGSYCSSIFRSAVQSRTNDYPLLKQQVGQCLLLFPQWSILPQHPLLVPLPQLPHVICHCNCKAMNKYSSFCLRMPSLYLNCSSHKIFGSSSTSESMKYDRGRDSFRKYRHLLLGGIFCFGDKTVKSTLLWKSGTRKWLWAKLKEGEVYIPQLLSECQQGSTQGLGSWIPLIYLFASV